MEKEESIRIRLDGEEKRKLQTILDVKYHGLPLSRWFRLKLKEEIEAFERENGPIQPD